jgi:DNA ligase (NAD+)
MFVVLSFNWNNLPFSTQFDGLEAARNWGFKVPKESRLVP